MKAYHLMQVFDLALVVGLAYLVSPYFLAAAPVCLYTPYYRKAYWGVRRRYWEYLDSRREEVGPYDEEYCE